VDIIEASRGRSTKESTAAAQCSGCFSNNSPQPPEDADRSLTNWFAFEEAISVLLEKSFGCKIEHRATRGKPDYGIDILASRQNGEVRETWVVQCKCYKSSNLIGPGHVRELLGAIADLNADDGITVKGMLVTTSRFSGDALKLAMKHGIHCVNGDDLTAIFDSVNRDSHPFN
jgi:HJR/Mrr/RecB family endonuclease